MATQQQQASLPDGHTKAADTSTGRDEIERGSIAWVRRLVEGFMRSKTAQTLTATHFKSEVVELSDDSAKDRVYCIRKNIFLAMRGDIPVPPEAEAAYNDKIKYRLMKDLDKAWKSIEPKAKNRRRSARDPNQFISESLELRMSGRATGGRSGRVELVPTIWVRCPEHQQASMKKALRDNCMGWAHSTELGKIMVGDAAKLLSSEASSPFEMPVGRGMLLESPRFAGVTLHLEIEDVATLTSIEGIFCRATLVQDGVVRSQKLSTIGGVVSIDGRPFGLTSAHAMFGNLWDSLCGSGGGVIEGDGIAQEAVRLNHSNLVEPNNLSSEDSSDEEDFSCYAEFARKPPAPSPMPKRWIAVELGDVANFLGLKATPMQGEQSVPPAIMFFKDGFKSDFALIRLDSISKSLGAGQSVWATNVDRADTAKNIDPGPVLIRLGEEEVPGTLLAYSAGLGIFKVSIPTQHVQLLQPLGKLLHGFLMTLPSLHCVTPINLWSLTQNTYSTRVFWSMGRP